MKKIIHISDLHLGYRDFERRFSSVVDGLKSKVRGRPSRYVVVITGDLVNNANKAGSYDEARRALDRLRRAGFKDILVIPGNHDYGTGKRGNKKFVKLFKDAFYGSEIAYPKLDIISKIAFVGLDSMAEELNWHDDLWAEGELGKIQLTKLDEILHRGKVRACAKRVVYLHHHPFKWRPLHQLKDARKLKKVLIRAIGGGISVDAVLFGHNHAGEAHNGKWGIARCYDGGTVTLKSRPKFVEWSPWFKVRSSSRIIDLNKDPAGDIVLPFRY